MTEFIGEPRRRSLTRASRPPDTIAMVVIIAFVVVALWVGREIFVPIAFAVLLSFVLAPVVRLLRHWRISRGPSVLIVVAVAFLVILGIGAILTRQITQLASEAPSYESTIVAKIDSVKGAASHLGLVQRASQLIQNIGSELSHAAGVNQQAPQPSAAPSSSGDSPVPVVVQQPPPAPLEILEGVALTAFSPLATMGIVLVFVVFILLQREDLRDRMIRLAGSHDLQRTTAAIDDAAQRLSRYFLAQTTVNAAFGLLIATGLWLIGVPGAPLWGILGMILRFVPYVGAIVSAAGPIALSAAVSRGWAMTLETTALFVVSESIAGQIVEPLLYGHSTGLSPIAVIVAATFWTWLWGPVGLILSTPLTVCLVVLGRHVDRLAFFDVLLGDDPPLTAVETFYQRVLAGHPMEAAEQAERMLRTMSLSDYYNDVAWPALLLAQADVRRGMLDDERQHTLYETIEELTEALSDRPDREPESAESQEEPVASLESAPTEGKPENSHAVSRRTGGEIELPVNESWRTGRAVVCVPGRSPLDRAAGLMLAQLLAAHGLAAGVEEGQILASRRIDRLDLNGVKLLCLSYFDAILNPAHVRFIIRRLRRRAPGLIILGGFWTGPEEAARHRDLCQECGADACVADLKQAIETCLRAGSPVDFEHRSPRNLQRERPQAGAAPVLNQSS